MIQDRYPIDIKCSACGESWGAHVGKVCPRSETAFTPALARVDKAPPATEIVAGTLPASRSALNTQVAGDHYKDLKIQPIEYIHANNIPFAEGCVIKYVSRWRNKGGIKDLEKAKHFLELLIELESRHE